MSTLIVCLPLQPAGTATPYGYVLTPDKRGPASHASAPVALLPQPAQSGGEVVAVVPLAALSWHRVKLPKGTGGTSARLRAVLDGLLEERLLDDPEALHFAVEPQAHSGATVWVAVCDKAWLRAAVGALEAAQRPVSRIVPEFAPDRSPTPLLSLHAIGTPEEACLVMTGQSTESGVTVLPLTRAGVALALHAAQGSHATLVVAEPAVAELAEQLLQCKVMLQQTAQRWLQAAESPWDLAQFDLANSGRSRAMKRLATLWQALLRAPQWRAVRWGLGLLLVANLLGLNAWAWREKTALNQQRAEIRNTLTQTFPGVRVVVDAPLQMEREVAALRQATGAASGRDLETILGALSTVAPANRNLSAIEFVANEIRVKGLGLSAEETADVTRRLQAARYVARTEGDSLLVRQEAER